jgi:general stress protein 26
MADAAEIKQHFWKKLSDSPFVMIGLDGDGQHSEPLTAQLDQDQVDTIWFFIGKDNRIDNDFGMIDKLWNNQVEAWFPGGKDDPNLALLRFDIDDAEMWETDMSIAGKVKMLFGGSIKAGDEGSHAKVGTTA